MGVPGADRGQLGLRHLEKRAYAFEGDAERGGDRRFAGAGLAQAQGDGMSRGQLGQRPCVHTATMPARGSRVCRSGLRHCTPYTNTVPDSREPGNQRL